MIFGNVSHFYHCDGESVSSQFILYYEAFDRALRF
jgi:hypothetical protein